MPLDRHLSQTRLKLASLLGPRGIALAVVLLVVALALGWKALSTRKQNQRAALYHFTLPTSQGEFSMASLRGKAVVLSFGYTSCPDFCPMLLGKVAAAVSTLSETRRARIVPVFVSVDGTKDTPEKVEKYVSYFFPSSTGITGFGVTGNKLEIDAIVDKFGATYTIEPNPQSALGYVVNHSTSFFLLNSSGEFVDTLPHDVKPEVLRDRIKDLL